MNTAAFKPLINLRTLNIKSVPQGLAYKLCNTLENIDIIHLTSKKHDISCFRLTSGSTYKESMIRTDLFKIATDPPSFTDSTNSTDDSNSDENESENIVLHIRKNHTARPTENTSQNLTSYEKMCIVYIVIAGE